MSDNTPSAATSADEFDPVFLHARKEAIIIFALWVVALLWSVPFCYLNGYPSQFDPQTFSTTLGIPTWLFWGILAPWLVADVFTMWFCFCYMKEDNLGEALEASAPEKEITEMHAADRKKDGA